MLLCKNHANAKATPCSQLLPRINPFATFPDTQQIIPLEPFDSRFDSPCLHPDHPLGSYRTLSTTLNLHLKTTPPRMMIHLLVPTCDSIIPFLFFYLLYIDCVSISTVIPLLAQA